MIEVTKFPVVIYSNYRTGSTPLAYAIGEQYNLRVFIEPSGHSPVRDYKISLFTDYYKTGKTDYVVKFMPDQQDHLIEFSDLLKSDAFKIKLLRQNKLQQIVSYYIAKKMRKWHQMSHEVIEDFTVDLNETDVDYAINKIINNDIIANQSTATFDDKLLYESLGYINNMHYVPDKDPTNINKVIDFIKQRIESKSK